MCEILFNVYTVFQTEQNNRCFTINFTLYYFLSLTNYKDTKFTSLQNTSLFITAMFDLNLEESR